MNRTMLNLTIGLTIGAMGVLSDTSYAALIFSDKLSDSLAIGIGAILFSGAAIQIMVTMNSAYPWIVASLDTLPVVIVTQISGAIASQMPSSVTSSELLLTVAIVIALATILTGIFLFLLGYLHLGKVVRYIPYPVIGGVIAGVELMLVKESLEEIAGISLNFAQLPTLFEKDILIQWLPGILFAIYLLVISRRYNHFLVLPANLFGAIGLFHLIHFLSGNKLVALTDLPTKVGFGHPISVLATTHVDWVIIFQQASSVSDYIAALVLSSAIALPLTLSSLELIAEKDINVNRELKVAGISNLCAGCFGGTVSFHDLDDSIIVEVHGDGENRGKMIR